MTENQIRDRIIELYTNWSNKLRFVRVLEDNENLESIPHNYTIPSENIRAESVSVDDLPTQILDHLKRIEVVHFAQRLQNSDIGNVTETPLANLGNTVNTVFTDFVGLTPPPNIVLWSFNHENEFRNQTNIPAGTNTRIGGETVEALIMRGLQNNIFIYRPNSINKFYPTNNRLLVNIIHSTTQTSFECTIQQRLEIVNPDDITRIHVTS